ncbi:hypothetical protein RND81_11G123600 [Saponaria officinalis]|uniref:Btz domain-containing protein n=1 Tax=Saponaria officinalis TaxID=3572 RepID=A0AAW1HL21_SAPOF
MAGEGGGAVDEENTDYESDPEEVKMMSLKMRRREASDDEVEEEEEERGNRSCSPRNSRSGGIVVDFDGDFDDQGGAADYDDENDVGDEEEDEYYDEYDEEEDEEEVVVGGEEYGEVEERVIGGGDAVVAKAENGTEAGIVVGEEGDGDGEVKEGGGEVEEEKKEVEPFSVPTSGAFYMHDDRFRGNVGGGGRHRRTFGGRKLWESKDERKWGHDKFEELNLHDRHYEEGRRSSRGSNQGRGKTRGTSGGYSRGNRGRGNSGNSNQNAAPKDVRGRGPRRYQPLIKNKGETLPPPYKQSARSFEKRSHSGSGRMAASTESSNVDHEAASAKKFGSNLSSASPPFYPSGSSTKDVALTQKKDLHSVNLNKNIQPSADPKFFMPTSNSTSRGKNIIDSTGIDRLHSDNTVSSANTKASSNSKSQSSSSLSSPNQFAHPKGQGRVVATYKPAVSQPPQINNQVNKVSSQATQANQQTLVLSQGQSTRLQAPGQQVAQRPLVASQSLSPPKAGKGAVQGTGRGSLVYGGGQVAGSGGNVGTGQGDPNMPAFFPVMQFGGQHPGGMGVPAVGMAFPGYVAQPNGLGNSEMTWLPVLASAANAMGAPYCPPYLAVDGNYHSRPAGQTSALPAPSKDNNLNKPNIELKPQPRSEVTNDEFSQRQNKPRRYSEMSFSQ